MSTREPQEDPKPPRPTDTDTDDDREARERAGADPFADENPAICRGID